MTMHRLSFALLTTSSLAALTLFVVGVAQAESPNVRPNAPLTFERDIRPILRAHCLDCHGATEALEGGLDLRLRRLLVRGGESGAAIVPGKPNASYLIERIRSGEMPPGEKGVSPKEMDVLARWIANGAPTAREEPKQLSVGLRITPEERSFWSFQPIRRPVVEMPPEAARARTPIDALLLKQLRDRDLAFSPDADRVTLIRRASLDLLGLPPRAEQVQEFVEDQSPNAYARMIDRLLESQHYGERWGRHWLDVAGYSDSEGATNSDAIRPWAYFYRDYVIRSFNEDKPFDRFLVEQLAGDELTLPPYRNLTAEQIELLSATGFLRMAADGTGSGGNNDAGRNQTIADTIRIVSTSLLGLSVGCAQCHDHRYDPIPQTDYYQLRAIFEPAFDWKKWRTPQQRLISLATDEDRKRSADLEAEASRIAAEKAGKQKQYLAEALSKELEKFDEPLRSRLREAYETAANKRNDEQKKLLKSHPSVNISAGTLYQYNQAAADDLKKYDKRIADVRAKKPTERFLRALSEPTGEPPKTHLFYRGEFKQPKQTVAPAGLQITAGENERLVIPDNEASLPSSGRRLAYARWLTNGRHPLLARVIVNRVWMHHFGRGIVGTPADFGVLGERPSHPGLLDWLAAEFMDGGWSLKALHRLIMNSTVYRQSSSASEQWLARDPDNLLYGKWPVHRLDAEVVRDRILATSGALNKKMHGPSESVKVDDSGQVVEGESIARRSVYVQVRRTQPLALLTAFDAPVMETNCARRPSSTVATQALMLMNSDFVLKESRRFAERIATQPLGGPLPEFVAKLAKELPLESPWRYGYGTWSAEAGTQFTALPHWTGSNWQGGTQLPDPTIGWVLLRAEGGHPGNAEHAAIRRWRAPQAGRYQVAGELSHGSPHGDGVRGRLVRDSNLIGEWTAHNGKATTTCEPIMLQAGDHIDLIVDCRSGETSDSYGWPVSITRLADDDSEPLTWRSNAEFAGPAEATRPLAFQVARAWQLAYNRDVTEQELRAALAFLRSHIQNPGAPATPSDKASPELAAMTNLCQALFSSNEFLYVD